MKFKHIEYFGIGLLIAALIGFWPRYFANFFDGTANFPYYFHLHAATALLWVMCLIFQPLLIRWKQRKWHKRIGKLSYLLVPVLLSSALLLKHYQFHQMQYEPGESLFRTVGLLIVFCYGYGIGIIKRNEFQIHARGMIAAGMSLIPPATGRVVGLVLGIEGFPGFILGVAPLYGLLIALIYLERDSTKGRWVFPGTLFVFLIYHTIQKTEFYPQFWESTAQWFYSLPLT